MSSSPVMPTDVGHLLRESVIVDCPACHHQGLSQLREEVVTVPQMVAYGINYLFCGFNVICWKGRFDYNHYCSKCGCYIGRHINFNYFLRRMMRSQRRIVENEYDEENERVHETTTVVVPVQQKNGTHGSNIGPAATTPLAPIAKQ